MVPCLFYALMEGGSLQDRLACRGSGALVPLTVNKRILALSDVAWGLAYLHSEARVIHRDVKSANVLLDRGCQGRIGAAWHR
jgi:serine/threonine protein kinase